MSRERLDDYPVRHPGKKEAPGHFAGQGRWKCLLSHGGLEPVELCSPIRLCCLSGIFLRTNTRRLPQVAARWQCVVCATAKVAGIRHICVRSARGGTVIRPGLNTQSARQWTGAPFFSSSAHMTKPRLASAARRGPEEPGCAVAARRLNTWAEQNQIEPVPR